MYYKRFKKFCIAIFFPALVFGASTPMTQEAEHFVLKRDIRAHRVSSGSRTITKGKSQIRVGFVKGGVEFVLTGVHGLNHPRIAVEGETQEIIEVEYSHGSEKIAFSKIVNALQLVESIEERDVCGWMLKPCSDRPTEKTNEWPKDLLTGRLLGNGDTYSYLVKRFKDGGKIYRKDNRLYVENVTIANLANFVESTSRKIVAPKNDGASKFSCSFDVADLRGWQYENQIKIGSQFLLERSTVKVPILVVGKTKKKNKLVRSDN